MDRVHLVQPLSLAGRPTAPGSAACGFRSEAELDLNHLKSKECPKNPPDEQVGCNELLAGTPVQLRSLVL